MDWRIYYSDGTTFSDEDGPWVIAPPKGVVCVVTLDPTGVWGRFVLQNHEFYYKTLDREVMCSEELSLVEVHVPDINPSQIKRGGNAWQDDWNTILHAATHDPDFPTGTPRRRVTDWDVDDPKRPHF